ncbi:MAG: methionine--tRNA ligase [Planctomycetota bacterium]|nr:methionine--tRNA ligase [Planctomycetota bacterium]
MSKAPDNFYITTAIDYPNGVPHMGHAYEKILADFYARAARLQGRDTWFLIGLDEHGLKIQNAAEEAGQAAQDFVDDKSRAFKGIYEKLGISYTDFIRTSEPRHHKFAQEIYQKVCEQDDIYKGDYETDYCVACEKALQKSDIAAGECADHPKTRIKEETYFFRLGKYRDAVREHIRENPDFIVPTERRNEILSRLDDEVHDLSISRSGFSWGVPLPNDPEHVLYVWFDALSSYISALKEPDSSREDRWPADCHVIGKDILWFHTVIWPAMLLSAGLPLPRQVYVHGFILDSDGRKMAKSLGNVVNPMQVVGEFGVDATRFYFLRAFASGHDGRFSIGDLEKRYNSELGNDLGNLIMRISKLGLSRAGGTLNPSEGIDDLGGQGVAAEYFEQVQARDHHRAIDTLWAFLRKINGYLTEKEPWKVDDDAAVEKILYTSTEAMSWALALLEPAMPSTAAAAAEVLGIELGNLAGFTPGEKSYTVQKAEPLFPRREKPKQDQPEKKKKKKQPQGEIDPFTKVELRVGIIEEVKEHPDADALYAMSVDIGGETRSICAGLREHLSAEELQGRKVLIVANFKPAKFRGIESRGMILASDLDDGTISPVDPGEAASGDLATVEGIESRPKKKLSRSEFEKVPLLIQDGRVTYAGKPLKTPAGEINCEAADGSSVR